MTTQQMPRQITASIHQDAINRVGDFFDATISTITNELLQNSRRAGSSRVDVTIDAGNRIKIADDGNGIADPEAILAFGLSQWNPTTTDRENPAGMGLYSLARRKEVRIQSKSAYSDAWCVNLTPDHFVGRLPAPVETVNDYDRPHGTTIEFTGNFSDEAMISQAARYYPLPVHVNGKPAPQVDFLKDALHTELWQGVRIGVYQSAIPLTYGQSGLLNFHGTLVNRPHLPYVKAIQSCWSAKVDVIDCPRLDLTLPARQEIVQSPFADELREACRATIYRAILLQPEPVDVPKIAQEDAANLGVNIPDATPKLEQWQSRSAETNYYHVEPKPRLPIGDDSILMTLDMPPPDQQTLSRAAERNDTSQRLFEPNPQLQGYDWYDAMTKVTGYGITVSDEKGDHNLLFARHTNTNISPRPNRIEFTLQTDAQDVKSDIQLPTDLAFEEEYEVYMDDVNPLVTQDSEISTQDLVEIMKLAFFQPSDDKNADSYDIQEDDHEAAYSMIATSLIESKDQAIINSVIAAVQRYILYQIPNGSTATIRVRQHEPTQVTISKDE